MNRLALLLPLLLGAALGFAQTTVSDAPKAGAFGPDILVPVTNVRQATDPAGRRYTQYLINKGVWRHTSIDDPISPLLSMHGHGPMSFLQPIQGYHPSDITNAYGIPIQSGSHAIAIIDAFNDPYLLSDFNTFCNAMGLPQETSTNLTASTNTVLQVVYANGTVPANNRSWAGEISLDTQWVHSIAPKAKIYLIEAASDSSVALEQAVQIANSLPDVKEISMSFGSNGEFAGEQTEDHFYTQAGIVYFAATGDVAGVRSYPAVSPNVVAVGGTSDNISAGVETSVSVWNSAGAGASTIVARPAFQNSVSSIVGKFRGTPDVSADADPNTGVALYDTYEGGWIVAGGTSLACPLVAAMTNVRGEFASNSQAQLTFFYSLLGGKFDRDVTTGSITTLNPTSLKPTGEVLKAAAGYDLATGIGEIIGAPSVAKSSSASAMKVTTGYTIGGSVANLNLQDGQTLVLSSAFSAGSGEGAGTQLTYGLANPAGYNLSTLSIHLYASGISSAVNTVYALNVLSNKFESIGTFNLSTAFVGADVSIDPSKYVAADGTVQIATTATRPLRFGMSPFAYRIDQAVLNAIYVP